MICAHPIETSYASTPLVPPAAKIHRPSVSEPVAATRFYYCVDGRFLLKRVFVHTIKKALRNYAKIVITLSTIVLGWGVGKKAPPKTTLSSQFLLTGLVLRAGVVTKGLRDYAPNRNYAY